MARQRSKQKNGKASVKGRGANRITALILIVAFALPGAAPAQSPDEDAKFDLKLREFGHTSGQVYQCAATDADRTDAERKAINAYTGISRLFGSDRAFAYAAAFGAGATDKLDKAKCPEYVKRFEEIRSKAKALAHEAPK